jgi:hypothetical protein
VDLIFSVTKEMALSVIASTAPAIPPAAFIFPDMIAAACRKEFMPFD